MKFIKSSTGSKFVKSAIDTKFVKAGGGVGLPGTIAPQPPMR